MCGEADTGETDATTAGQFATIIFHGSDNSEGHKGFEMTYS